MAGGLIVFLILMTAISIIILVAISRWIFRINDIVKRLDTIISRLPIPANSDRGSKGE